MINDRVYKLIKVLGMHPTSFAESLGVSVTVIFNIIKGRRSKPSYDLILNILETYGELNAEWLIKGSGAMWNDDIVVSAEITPAYVDIHNRIKELFAQLTAENSLSYELSELEELVTHIMKETIEQKNKLVHAHERLENVVQTLQRKLKLKI